MHFFFWGCTGGRVDEGGSELPKVIDYIPRLLCWSLWLFFFLVPVEIVQGPVETTHFAGGNISLYCRASGIPSAAFVWYKDGQQVFEDGKVAIFNTTLTDTPSEIVIQNTLSFTDLMLSDDADYLCEASNSGAYGTVFVVESDPAHLNVQREHTGIQVHASFSLC